MLSSVPEMQADARRWKTDEMVDCGMLRYRIAFLIILAFICAVCPACSENSGPPAVQGQHIAQEEELLPAFADVPLTDFIETPGSFEEKAASVRTEDEPLTEEQWESSHAEGEVLDSEDVFSGGACGGGSISITLPRFSGESAAIKSINSFFDELMKALKSESCPEGADISFDYEQRYLDKNVLSVAVFRDVASGGKSTGSTEFYIFSLDDGRPLTLRDFFGDDAADTLNSAARRYIHEHSLEKRVYSAFLGADADFLSADGCAFTPDPDFFTLFFNPGSIGPEENGPMLIPVEYGLAIWSPSFG